MTDAATNLHPGLNLGPSHGEAHEEAEVVTFGFWVFLMSDLVTFGLFFATFATMWGSTAGGPGPEEIVNLGSIAAQTTLLLASTLTFGFASIAMKYHDAPGRIAMWLGVTALLGAGFVALEVKDFIHMAEIGAVPQRSGYLSAFWSLVGLHGLHVSMGIVFVGVMVLQIYLLGMTSRVKSRLLRLALYWHFLDIVWVGIMSGVFLAGAL
ncbi:cytochrome c oxidase subunit 3 [Acuticoccus sediminis]|uniref:cytochrome c oxidase subunit 3 n=1 Tax=Acuticoccus sediminis TaxID=2184697 RepID=UPI001CFEF89B|nr:cytochrome c oxidase subunit 3 [Acuticoccus sediminis]